MLTTMLVTLLPPCMSSSLPSGLSSGRLCLATRQVGIQILLIHGLNGSSSKPPYKLSICLEQRHVLQQVQQTEPSPRKTQANAHQQLLNVLIQQHQMATVGTMPP